jgi:hypothetical protein
MLRQLPTQKQSKELAATHGLRVDRHGVFRIRITEMDAAMKVHTHDRLLSHSAGGSETHLDCGS